jgi:ketosteroid isomerase-like protein
MPAGLGTRRVLAVAAAAVVALAVWQLWPSDARRVRGKLDLLASVVNERPSDGLGQVARTAQLAQLFTEDVVLEPGQGAGAIRGRERLLALASRAPNDGDPFKLSFVDVSVRVAGDDATAHLTATLASRDPETGEENVDAREVELQFRHAGDWRISRISLIDTLEKPH